MRATPVHKVFVGIGSNINKEHNITSAVRSLREVFGELELSPVYESLAVGFSGDNFYNMVVGFSTPCSPRQVQDILREIEHKHLRVRGKNKFESRTLDLDQLLYDNLAVDENGVNLPNQDVVKYPFILHPLKDIAGDVLHPLLGKPIAELQCDDGDTGTLLEHFAFAELAKT